jgi:DNA-binding NarL/FixJ family response regulator
MIYMDNTGVLNIVLTEKDPKLREMFREAFAAQKFKTNLHIVNNSEALIVFLDRMEKQPPHLIFMNYNQLISPYFNCLPTIRHFKWCQDATIAVYASEGTDEQLEEVLVHGGNIFINKALELSAMIKVIEEVCILNLQYIAAGIPMYNFLMNINGERHYQISSKNRKMIAKEVND